MLILSIAALQQWCSPCWTLSTREVSVFARFISGTSQKTAAENLLVNLNSLLLKLMIADTSSVMGYRDLDDPTKVKLTGAFTSLLAPEPHSLTVTQSYVMIVYIDGMQSTLHVRTRLQPYR